MMLFDAPRETAIGPSRHIALPHEPGRCGGKADVAFVASRRWVYGTRPSTTLAECVCAAVFQGFVFGSTDTAETAPEG
jgi:hypothetical protein